MTIRAKRGILCNQYGRRHFPLAQIRGGTGQAVPVVSGQAVPVVVPVVPVVSPRGVPWRDQRAKDCLGRSESRRGTGQAIHIAPWLRGFQ
jgi:hypothetical protein